MTVEKRFFINDNVLFKTMKDDTGNFHESACACPFKPGVTCGISCLAFDITQNAEWHYFAYCDRWPKDNCWGDGRFPLDFWNENKEENANGDDEKPL